MSNKPWPVPVKSAQNCGEELKPLPQPWPQLPAKVDCGHSAKAEIEIDGAEVVPFASVSRSTTTVAQQTPWRWQKGVSGNPQGRKTGSKHKITELARSIVAEDFAEHGRATLERERLIDPVAYLQLVFKFVPRELILQREQGHCIDYGALTDEEFVRFSEEAMKRGKYEKMLEQAVEFAKGKR